MEDAIVHKKCFSTQPEPHVADRFVSLKRDKIVVVGTEGCVCVLQTTLDMMHAGYQTHLQVDGTSSRRQNDNDVAIRRMYAHGVELVTLEMVLFEWLEQGDTKIFKELFPLIRNR